MSDLDNYINNDWLHEPDISDIDAKLYEHCWSSGIYLDQDCVCCPHYDECSGSDSSDDEE